MSAAPMPVEKGTLDVLVLRALSWAPMHGVEIIAWLEAQSDGGLALDDSGVYQALYRMEQRGLVEAEWGMTEKRRRARYYTATAQGRAYLRAETKKWMRYTSLVMSLLARTPASARGRA
jgi:PadR family transcriptional regulator, regulatory protein PadR